MNQEIIHLEELKHVEIQLMQQVYEQKINYLNTKLQLLTKEMNKKDQEIMRIGQQNQDVNKIKIEQSQMDLEAEKQYQKEYLNTLYLEKDLEVDKLKNQYSKDVQNCQILLGNRDKIIEELNRNLQSIWTIRKFNVYHKFLICLVNYNYYYDYDSIKNQILYKSILNSSKYVSIKQYKMNQREQQQFNNNQVRVQEIKKKIQKPQFQQLYSSTYLREGIISQNLNFMNLKFMPFHQWFTKNQKVIKPKNWFDDIPILVGVDEIKESEICSICLQEINEGKLIKILKCNHYFHDDCIKEWVLRKAECPTCRDNIH
ncbi:unnamed protein product [Paramecium pentaurelia]|uniref:RING-type domain-containing protein n=1 Tax=Paramecium pentaurelia TaxID=43138 RepID=A0A8S1Y5Y4_9CILI|nr:unnamed protein product [Paramecium pentaurelia]